MSLLDQYLLDQQSLDVDMPDVFVSPEEWTGFLQDVLETTVAAYLTLKQENIASSNWEEDTFTINMEKYMNLLTRRYKFPLRTQMQALRAARRLSSSDQLKLCNPGPVNNFIFYESCHRRHFCNQDIRLYHFFLTFDFAA